MFRRLLSEGRDHEDEDHDGGASFLLYNCAAMFLGAFFVGTLPLMMDLGEGRLKVLSIFSAGLMAGRLPTVASRARFPSSFRFNDTLRSVGRSPCSLTGAPER